MEVYLSHTLQLPLEEGGISKWTHCTERPRNALGHRAAGPRQSPERLLCTRSALSVTGSFSLEGRGSMTLINCYSLAPAFEATLHHSPTRRRY